MVVLILVAFAVVFIALVASLVVLYTVEENRMKSFNKEVWAEHAGEAIPTENVFKEVVAAKKSMNRRIKPLPVAERHDMPVGKVWKSSIPNPLVGVASVGSTQNEEIALSLN